MAAKSDKTNSEKPAPKSSQKAPKTSSKPKKQLEEDEDDLDEEEIETTGTKKPSQVNMAELTMVLAVDVFSISGTNDHAAMLWAKT